jgi:hypothetical protein
LHVAQWADRLKSTLNRRPLLLFAVLYAVVAGIGTFAESVLPAQLHLAVEALTNGAGLGSFSGLGREARTLPLPAAPLWSVSTVAMLAAALLTLPLAWLYTLTRQKRGYQQSVVHTLILLPVIVAGVVVMVKYSLALAFSLTGIVAAVRFRNTLEDSKDAVYIFVATSVGLASGVELTVAYALSLVFSLITVLLFKSDFGRTPARLEGEKAQQRLERARAVANRTSQFVARIDKEILQEMAPEQLEALADRAWRRRQEAGGSTADEEADRFDAVLRIRTDSAGDVRPLVAVALERHTKRWQFRSSEEAEGGQVLEYALRLRKSVSPTTLLDALRKDVPGILDAQLA